MNHLQNYIDGKWVDAANGSTFDVFDPATGEVIAKASDSQPTMWPTRSTPRVERSTRGRGRGSAKEKGSRSS